MNKQLKKCTWVPKNINANRFYQVDIVHENEDDA